VPENGVQGADFCIDGQFFLQLPFQGLRGCLAGFDLAAGQFPEAGMAARAQAPAEQVLSLSSWSDSGQQSAADQDLPPFRPAVLAGVHHEAVFIPAVVVAAGRADQAQRPAGGLDLAVLLVACFSVIRFNAVQPDRLELYEVMQQLF
jgi:hypothetical protein